jgi:hypothetical protein
MFIVTLWRALKRLYTFLLPIRFSLIALAVLAFAFLLSDQGSDILRALAEDRQREGQAAGGTAGRLILLMLATNLLAYTVWYWSRQLLRYRPHLSPDLDPRALPSWTKWTPRVAGLFVFVIEIAGFAKIAMGAAAERTNMLWAAIGLLALSALLYLIVVVKRRDLMKLERAENEEPARVLRDFAGATRGVLLTTILFEIALFIWALINPVSWWIFGVAAVLVITIGIWVPVGSALVAVGEYWRFPILGALLVWALAISCWNDNHKIRTAGALPAGRPTIDKAFDDWYARMSARYPSGDIPVVIVATEGGGIRAAYWTSTVLTVLQDQIPSFSDHCFAISGVSGGSLGAAVFNTLLARRIEAAAATAADGRAATQTAMPNPTGTMHGESRAVLDFDALSGTLAAMSQPDLAQRFIPFPFLPDRAAALEKGWQHGWYRAFRGTPHADMFGQGFLATMQKHPELPVLLLNGTMVETGDRIMTSTTAMRPSLGFRNAFDAFDQLQTDIPISTAALMSARFTYVSPAGKIPNQHPQLKRPVFGHVIDGGYFENSGGVTAAEVVALVNEKRMAGYRVKPFVIVIDFFESSRQKAGDPRPFCPAPGECGPGAPNTTERFANELLSPLRGLLSTRGARGAQAIGDVLANNIEFVEFRLIPRTVPLPLGWVLSERAQDAIDSAMDCEGGNRSATRILAQALGSPLPFDWKDPVAERLRAQGAYLPRCTTTQMLPPVNCRRAGCGDASNLKDLDE